MTMGSVERKRKGLVIVLWRRSLAKLDAVSSFCISFGLVSPSIKSVADMRSQKPPAIPSRAQKTSRQPRL